MTTATTTTTTTTTVSTRRVRLGATRTTLLVSLCFLLLHRTTLAADDISRKAKLSININCNADGTLCDHHEACGKWQQAGECFKNKPYMTTQCALSCQEGCADAHPRCPIWASSKMRECEENPVVMQTYCPLSCGYCKPCHDNEVGKCPVWADRGECDKNPVFMNQKCAKSCGTCETQPQMKRTALPELDPIKEALLDWTATVGVRQTATGNEANRTLGIIRSTRAYWIEATATLSEARMDHCWNRDTLCSYWVLAGECENNPPYMTTKCAPACRSCDKVVLPSTADGDDEADDDTTNSSNPSDIALKCPPNDELQPALRPGFLNRLFEQIASSSQQQQSTSVVTVLSSPSDAPATESSIVMDKSLSPWVLQLDDFMSPDECDAMIQLGIKQGFQQQQQQQSVLPRTTATAAVKNDTATAAISGNDNDDMSICSFASGCRDFDLPKILHERLAWILQIQVNHTASFQIRRLSINEDEIIAKPRHNFAAGDEDKSGGPRVLSFIVYLTDAAAQNQPQGRTTGFPQLGVSAMHQRGRALLWPNVYNSDPFKRDSRLIYSHENGPLAGNYYVLQVGIHMYDIATPEHNRCFE